MPLERALASSRVQRFDYVTDYVEDLPLVLDIDAIRRADLTLGVDPLGGASLAYWQAIQQRLALDLKIVNDRLDPTFSFLTLDHDGRIRMDCSSPDAMAGLIGLKDRFDVAFANDPDSDRHGVVTRSSGLLNPNHYLSAVIDYLFRNRIGWSRTAAVGKTLVSSGMMDRVAQAVQRELVEVPVGFKWFVQGLLEGSLGFGGEESAGASFLDLRGRAWSSDKDGILLALLAAEMTARQGCDPGVSYRSLTERFGAPVYRRLDAPANPKQREALKKLSPERVPARELAGEPVRQVLTRAPGKCADRRPQGRDGQRLVRGPALGNGIHLQDLRGELPGRGAPEPDHRRGTDGCRRRSGATVDRTRPSFAVGSVGSRPPGSRQQLCDGYRPAALRAKRSAGADAVVAAPSPDWRHAHYGVLVRGPWDRPGRLGHRSL